MKQYRAEGKIEYKQKDGWVILHVPPSVINYYKFWVEKFIGKKISTSYHGSHTTIVAGKYDAGLVSHRRWGEYHNQKIEFFYDSHIYTDHDWFCRGKYFWLRVHSPLLFKIREDLGLKPRPFNPFHSTIGYCGC